MARVALSSAGCDAVDDEANTSAGALTVAVAAAECVSMGKDTGVSNNDIGGVATDEE